MLTEKDYPILDAIERHKPASQRALAKLCGMSLGKTNYTLKRLIEFGVVKVSKTRDSSNRSLNVYELTAEGLEAKAQLMTSFIRARTQEFQNFSDRLLENLLRVQHLDVSRLLVLGSQSIGKLLAYIARREDLSVLVIGTVSEPDQFDCFTPEAYDHILVADDPGAFSNLIQTGKIPANKITYLK